MCRTEYVWDIYMQDWMKYTLDSYRIIEWTKQCHIYIQKAINFIFILTKRIKLFQMHLLQYYHDYRGQLNERKKKQKVIKWRYGTNANDVRKNVNIYISIELKSSKQKKIYLFCILLNNYLKVFNLIYRSFRD